MDKILIQMHREPTAPPPTTGVAESLEESGEKAAAAAITFVHVHDDEPEILQKVCGGGEALQHWSSEIFAKLI